MYKTPLKAIAFDLDGTLAESKLPITHEMSNLINRLLASKAVLIMSGGSLEQIEKQFLNHLGNSQIFWKNLYLMPTSGAEFLVWDNQDKKWTERYAYKFTEDEFSRIKNAFNYALDKLNLKNIETFGPQIENRGTQITFSALGQNAPIEKKEIWDPDASKRTQIVNIINPLIPEFSIKMGGSTSIDVNRHGIDKAFGIEKFMKYTGIRKSEILYVGDALYKGGNDSVVNSVGVKTYPVRNPKDTIALIRSLINPHIFLQEILYNVDN